MKLVGTEASRVIWFFSIEEVRPERGADLGLLLETIKKRYSFVVAPDLVRTVTEPAEGMTFKSGRIDNAGGSILIKEFFVTQGAWIINCEASEHCRYFWKDLWANVLIPLGYREPIRVQLAYRTVLIIEFEPQFETVLNQWQGLMTLISDQIGKHTGYSEKIHLRTLRFSADPQKNPHAEISSNLVIERRLNYPFEHNRFYCDGPFPSSEFVSILADIEKHYLAQHS